MLELYHHQTSVCSSKVRFAIAEKGQEFESRIVDLGKNEQHTPEYRKLNPKSVVPTLVHDGAVVVESNVINEYIDEVFPGTALKPADPAGRARMRVWTKQLDEDIHEFTSVVSFAIAFRYGVLSRSEDQREAYFVQIKDPARRDRLREAVAKGVEAAHVIPALKRLDRLAVDMDAALKNREWLAGDTFSLADIAFAPYIARFDNLGMDFLWAERPALAGWYGRLQEMDTFHQSHTAWTKTFPMMGLMKAKGVEAAPTIKMLLSQR